MTPSSPATAAAGQRLLAAIVFTDVVSFSARVQSEESATLNLVERDFAVMRDLGTKLSGRVIKSTGDGLLVFFASAVQAMEWSLQIQRQFAVQARTLPPGEFLRHRVGVHVGDVFLTEDDVMGDGVNIAARVQTEAPAGGICISQSVYDLVKNKMKLDVIRLEPRKLKNIAEFIQMYHVLLEPRAVVAAPPAALPRPTAVTPGGSEPRRPKFAILAAIVALSLGGAWLVQAYFEHEKELKRNQAKQAQLGALLANRNPTGPGEKAPPTVPAGPAASREMDFAQRALERRPGAAATNEDERLLREAKDCLPPTIDWAMAELLRYSIDRPLRVRPLGRSASQVLTVYSSSPDRRIYFAEGGAVRPRPWDELRREHQGAILLSLLRAAQQPPPEVMRGAGAFAYVHGLPDMARDLIDGPRANAPAR